MAHTNLDSTVAACSELGAEAAGYSMDVSHEGQVATALDAVVNEFGAVDVLVNNAGIVKDGLLVKARDGRVIDRMSLSQ